MSVEGPPFPSVDVQCIAALRGDLKDTMPVGPAPEEGEAPDKDVDIEACCVVLTATIGLDPLDLTRVSDIQKATRNLRSALAKVKPQIDRCIAAGCLLPLVHMLTTRVISDHTVLLDAAWALTNIASGDSGHTKQVVDHNGVVAFLTCLEPGNHHEVMSQAVWGLGNIIGDNVGFRDLFTPQILRPILACAPQFMNITEWRNLTWTLSNVSRGKPKPDREAVKQMLPLVCQLLHVQTDSEIIENCLWTMSYASDGPNQCIQDVLETGILEVIVEKLRGGVPTRTADAVDEGLLETVRSHDYVQSRAKANADCVRHILEFVPGGSKYNTTVFLCKDWFYDVVIYNPHLYNKAVRPAMQDAKIVTPALRTIGNIVTGDDAQTQAVLSVPNILTFIHSLLHHTKRAIRKEAVWTLSNIAAGNRDQIQSLLDTPGLNDQIGHLVMSDHKDVVKESAWTISNMCAGGAREQHRHLAKGGTLVALLRAADAQVDKKVVGVVAEGLLNTFDEKADGLWSKPSDELMVKYTTAPWPRAPSFINGHGFHQVFREDDPAELRESMALQCVAFDLGPRLRSMSARGVDVSRLLESLGMDGMDDDSSDDGDEEDARQDDDKGDSEHEDTS